MILRNYDGLPDRVGHDIDLLVEPGAVTSLLHIIWATTLAQKWHPVRFVSRYGFHSITVARISSTDPAVLKWDVLSPILWAGVPWVDSKRVLQERRLLGEIPLPSAGCEAAILLLKDVIHGQEIREKYTRRVQILLQYDELGFRSAYGDLFSNERVSWLVRAARSGQRDRLNTAVNAIRYDLMSRALLRNPAKTAAGVTRFAVSWLLRRVKAGRASGYFLCLLGPDGSGKTALSNAVAERLADAFETTRYYHSRFGLLPELKRLARWLPLRKRSILQDRDSGSRDSAAGPGWLMATVYLLYYSIDYLIGHVVIILARLRGELVIFDRYFHDYAIQPGPFSVESRVFRFLLSIVPRPDALVYARASAETIRARKPELSSADILLRGLACEQLAERTPYAHVVDTSQPLDKATAEICHIVLSELAERFAQRRPPLWARPDP